MIKKFASKRTESQYDGTGSTVFLELCLMIHTGIPGLSSNSKF